MMREGFDNLMSAITFCEAGEHATARELMKRRKTVLLAVSDKMFDGNALKYALNISDRIGAHLEILYVTECGTEAVGIKAFLSAVEKVGFRFSLVKKEGCVKKEILDYTDKRSDIQFVIIGSDHELDVECKTADRPLIDVWKRLKCPLVVVSRNQQPLPA